MHKPFITVALFGEARKGDFRQGYYCTSVAELSDFLGEPPKQSLGIPFAIQALSYNRDVIFFRVHEEGFSTQDYLQGLNILEDKSLVESLSAICMPGVGNAEIIEATLPICAVHQSCLIVSECDLYDYLTYRHPLN